MPYRLAKPANTKREDKEPQLDSSYVDLLKICVRRSLPCTERVTFSHVRFAVPVAGVESGEEFQKAALFSR